MSGHSPGLPHLTACNTETSPHPSSGKCLSFRS
nr:MAG TPA: hypothetical protein [Caudoviricetes sp.]